MIKHDISRLLAEGREKGLTGREALRQSSFDCLIRLDPDEASFCIIEDVVDKYYGVAREGGFPRFVAYAADRFVHPEDRESYLRFMDMETMPARLAKAGSPGLVEEDVRLRATNDAWIRTRILLLRGDLLDPEDPDCIWMLVYDMGETVQEDHFSIGLDPAHTDEARYESVTGLLSGMDFFRPAQERIEEFRNGWCLINIDIKHYKMFVDWYGVESGQYLLSQCAEILREVERAEHGMAGYMGQDQFCLIIPYNPDKIEALQAELQELIASISPIEGFTPYLGIAEIDDSSNQIQEFFNRAALTTDEIKDSIYTRIRVYDEKVHKQNAREYEILFAFQNAIERGEITFYLQPQFRVSNRKIVGAESLARWKRSDGRWISPVEFVPILEKHGQVSRLDQYIWESVCAWCRSWIDRGHSLVPVSVNVSRQDITAMDVPAYLEELLDRYGLTTADIQIEITETAYADDLNPVQETVQILRQRGFSVLMDDFGSGYSSLSMLRNLNMDVIKLDAQFLQLNRDEENKGVSILESIVNMTRSLSTPIIVEGVENEYQAKFLADLGCTYMQGFYFARPMSVEEFESLLCEESRVDGQGFVFKANQQLRVREFFDENVYSDAVLNNILGPIAFYNLNGEDISIIRYNEQFFEMAGLTEQEMSRRIQHIQDYMPEEDHRKLLHILQNAEEHMTLGGHGVVRAMKPNGVYIWMEHQVFFLKQDAQGKKFYVSVRDVTETSFASADMPGAYYRTTVDDDFEFLFISQNFLEMTGYTEEEIRTEFDNKQINMVHPADVARLREWSHEILDGRRYEDNPYRIRRKRGDYIYIVERDRLTDHFGALNYQSIAIDVTDMMALRNQMWILSKYLTDTIIFVRPLGETMEFEPVIYDLEETLGMSSGEFGEALNDGTFFEMIEGYDRMRRQTKMTRTDFIKWYFSELVGGQKRMTLNLPSGETIRLTAHADRVRDDRTRVEYIIMLRS